MTETALLTPQDDNNRFDNDRTLNLITSLMSLPDNTKSALETVFSQMSSDKDIEKLANYLNEVNKSTKEHDKHLKQHDGKIGSLDKRTKHLEKASTIDGPQTDFIVDQAHGRAIVMMGGYNSTCYLKHHQRIYDAIKRDCTKNFGIKAYRDILLTDYAAAQDFIKIWRPSESITKFIRETNQYDNQTELF